MKERTQSGLFITSIHSDREDEGQPNTNAIFIYVNACQSQLLKPGHTEPRPTCKTCPASAYLRPTLPAHLKPAQTCFKSTQG